MKTPPEDASGSRFHANRVFTDREVPIATVLSALRACHVDGSAIIWYYGVGGIGKTRLHRELIAMLREIADERLAIAPLDLSTPDLCLADQGLMYLRRSLPYSCHTFDIAAARYWTILGRPFVEISANRFLAEGTVLTEAIEYSKTIGAELAGAGGLVPGVPLLIRLSKSSKKHWIRWTHKHKDLLQEMEKLDASDLYQRLSMYLAVDISDAADDGYRTVLLIDSYERLWSRAGHSLLTRSLEDDAWIRNLVLNTRGTLAVCFGREAAAWDSCLSDDRRITVGKNSLEELQVQDVQKFLERVPISDLRLVEHIAVLSRGHPLLLDVCVDIYERLIRQGTSPRVEDFGRTNKEVLDTFQRHLSLQERGLVCMLAVPLHFDQRQIGRAHVELQSP